MSKIELGAANSFQDIEVCSFDPEVENLCMIMAFQQPDTQEVGMWCFSEQELTEILEEGSEVNVWLPQLDQYNEFVPTLMQNGYVQVCRSEEEIQPGAHALFSLRPRVQMSAGAQITAQPEMGGIENLYSNSIPLCTGGMEIERVVLIESNQNTDVRSVDLGVDPYAVYGLPWRDPRPEEISDVGKYMEDAGAVAFCQLPVTQNPVRYGLFWVMKPDPLSAFDSLSVATDAASQQRINEELMAALPEEFRKCMPSEEDAMQPYLMMEEYNRRLYELEMERIPPFVTEQASLMAIHVVNEAGLIDAQEKELKILTDILAQALEHNIPEEEVSRIASELSYRFDDTPGFIYGLITMISLRIGEILHYRNSVNGGIVRDYDLYAKSIEEAIMDGRIDLRVMSAAETIRTPAGALYNPLFNEIGFPALNGYTSIATMIEPVLHECYHAWQDMKALPMTRGLLELEAHTMGKRAQMLLMGPDTITEDSVLMDLFVRGQTMQAESQKKNADCIAVSDSSLLLMNELMTETSEWVRAWQMALAAEIAGNQDMNSSFLFRKYHSITNYFMVNQFLMMESLFRAYENSKSMRDLSPGEKDAFWQSVSVSIGDYFKTVLMAVPGTFEQGAAALNFLSYSGYAGQLLFFADPDKYMEMSEIQPDRNMIDFIATTLLFMPANCDGI